MYFTMVSHVEDGVTYTRRVGAMTSSFHAAVQKATKRGGFVVDESNYVIAQAMSPDLPKYVGSIINIGSGEDSYV